MSQLEEYANSVCSLYDDNAELWIKLRGQSKLPERKYLDKINSLIPNGSRILDLGCGDGIIAEYFAAKGHFIFGVEASKKLCKAFDEKVKNGEAINADIRQFEAFAGYNLILLWHSLFHLTPENQRQILARIGKAADPKCVLAFTSGDAYDESLGEFAQEPLYHASLSPDEYQEILTTNGIKLIDKSLNDAECGNISVWIAVKQ